MTEDNSLQIIEALAKGEDELLEELGAWLLGSGPGFGPSDLDRKVRFAQTWIGARHDEFRRALCGEVKLKLEHGGYDKLTEVATVADALAAIWGKPPATIVAVILLRRGLRNLCEG